MAKDEKGSSDAEVVEPEEKKLIVTSGIGAEVLQSGLATIPQLNDTMTTEERRDTIRVALTVIMELPDRAEVMAGEQLYEVRENEYWKAWIIPDPDTGENRPYASFEEYADLELGIKRRKAYYLCSIYEKFVVELGLGVDVLTGLEWSKAKELLNVITVENHTELIDKLGSMTVKQVQDMVKEMQGKKPKDSEASEGETTHRLSFTLSQEQLDSINGALTLAKSMCGSDKPGAALDLICMEFVASSSEEGLEGAMASLSSVIKNIQRAYSVELDIKEMDTDRYAEVADTSEAEAAAG